jgi:Tc toxin complex TcA C-terminal TcB-binding domain
VTLPEAVFGLGCAGHYLRRIKAVGFSIPCVVGPHTSVNCTATLLRSSIRMSRGCSRATTPASPQLQEREI